MNHVQKARFANNSAISLKNDHVNIIKSFKNVKTKPTHYSDLQSVHTFWSLLSYIVQLNLIIVLLGHGANEL